jgi:8-oxo-dGTP pyrophosphatase MutT (NUDIX family)
MVREISAGGVVVRNQDGEWWMAAIELPSGSPAGPSNLAGSMLAASTPGIPKAATRRGPKPKSTPVVCLPKGLVDAGEKPLEAALREVREETGLTASQVTKLDDIKYVYARSWGHGERVFKIVTFYLLQYESGSIDQIADEMRIEVARASWIRLEDAPKLLAYRGEKQVARKALEYISAHPDL